MLLNSVCHRQLLSICTVTHPKQSEFSREIRESSTPIKRSSMDDQPLFVLTANLPL